jgi:hypothetical protein
MLRDDRVSFRTEEASVRATEIIEDFANVHLVRSFGELGRYGRVLEVKAH